MELMWSKRKVNSNSKKLGYCSEVPKTVACKSEIQENYHTSSINELRKNIYVHAACNACNACPLM